MDITQFAVPVGPPAVMPQGSAALATTPGPNKGPDYVTTVLIVTIVLLVLLIAYSVWRHRYHAKPDCSKGSAVSQQVCQTLTGVCKSDILAGKSQVNGCMNAVAHCMPVVDSLSSAAGKSPAAMVAALNGPSLKACTRAITHVDPTYVAKLATAYGSSDTCVPAEMSTLFSNDADYRALLGVAQAAAPLTPYALRVARHLPVCAAPPAPTPVPVGPH
jgi:hypothetical protein